MDQPVISTDQPGTSTSGQDKGKQRAVIADDMDTHMSQPVQGKRLQSQYQLSV